jgi:glycerol-3-phosphate dehydrogenase
VKQRTPQKEAIHLYSFKERTHFFNTLNNYSFDVLVIGGGITGAGIALDASSRGLSVALVDMQDFAAGTSSRSTKLVHGGLRYLKQFEIGLVADVGSEREIVYENAVHVTKPEWMLLPIYKTGSL